MTDRLPTKILANGAIRYGVYDEAGNLLRYEYIKPEDEPTAEGTELSKKTLLSDDAEIKIFGNAADRTVDEAIRGITQVITVTVPVAWSGDSTAGYTQTIAVSGILAADTPIADVLMGDDVTANGYAELAWRAVSRITTADGSITLHCYAEPPSTSFNIQLKVVR